MDLNQLKKDLEDRTKKAVDVLADKLKGLRGSMASPALVEGVKVEYYNSPTPLRQVAAINIPEPKQLVIKPFEASLLPQIEKAIISANIGLTPQNDGKVLRLNIPPLSEERRMKLVDQVKKFGEEAKVSVRNVRRDALKHLDDVCKEKKLSEDVKFKEKDSIQKKIDEHEKRIESIIQTKIKELKD